MLRSNLVICNCLVAYDLVARYIIPIDSVAGLEARLRRLLPTPRGVRSWWGCTISRQEFLEEMERRA